MVKKLSCLLLCLLLCAGCAGAGGIAPANSSAADSGTTPPISPPAAATDLGVAPVPPIASSDPIYHLYTLDQNFTFAADGRLLPNEEAYTPLYDVDSHVEQYRLLTRQEDTGEDTEYGDPVTKRYSALYTVDGTQLHDWEGISYRPAMGSLVIRQDEKNMWGDPSELGDSYQTALWNPLTGETVLDGVDTVQRIEEGRFLALDVTGKALGTIDQNGAILSGFPVNVDYFYPTTKHGVLTGDTRNPYASSERDIKKPSREFLLDHDFNVLLERERLNLSFTDLRGPYLSYEQGDERGIIALPDLTEIFTINKDIDISYFDGERAVLREGTRGEWKHYLVDLEGNALSENFDSLWPPDQYDAQDDATPASEFLATKGDQATLIDRNGKALASATFPQLDGISTLGKGLYSYQIRADNNDYSSYRTGLLDASFNVILPAKDYDYISKIYYYQGPSATNTNLLMAAKLLPDGMQLFDLLDSSGKVVLSNVSQMGGISDNRIAIRRGFSVGLIDYQGNWVAKHSVYGVLDDD